MENIALYLSYELEQIEYYNKNLLLVDNVVIEINKNFNYYNVDAKISEATFFFDLIIYKSFQTIDFSLFSNNSIMKI